MAKAKREKGETKHCDSCNKDLVLVNFYNTKSPLSIDGKMNICKKCLGKMIDVKNMSTVYKVLQMMDLPFFYDVWERAKEIKPDNPWAYYIPQANSGLNEFKGATYRNSMFEASKKNDNDNDLSQSSEQGVNTQEIENLKEKYGYGYPDDEYMLFEKKYQQLRPSVKLLTTMHDEFFREYCVDKVKETLAKSKGDFKEAKEWANMAKDAATAGKLNPNQMSKSDLSGGMDTFGQMRRMVEETEGGELLGLLPKFIERPKDKVDITLWLYINYIRDLKGLPPCEYKEIYNFYEIRRQSYEQQSLDHQLESEEKEDGLDA